MHECVNVAAALSGAQPAKQTRLLCSRAWGTASSRRAQWRARAAAAVSSARLHKTKSARTRTLFSAPPKPTYSLRSRAFISLDMLSFLTAWGRPGAGAGVERSGTAGSGAGLLRSAAVRARWRCAGGAGGALRSRALQRRPGAAARPPGGWSHLWRHLVGIEPLLLLLLLPWLLAGRGDLACVLPELPQLLGTRKEHGPATRRARLGRQQAGGGPGSELERHFGPSAALCGRLGCLVARGGGCGCAGVSGRGLSGNGAAHGALRGGDAAQWAPAAAPALMRCAGARLLYNKYWHRAAGVTAASQLALQ